MRFFYNHFGRSWHSVSLWIVTGDNMKAKLWTHESELTSNSEVMDKWEWERVSIIIPHTETE